MVSAGPLAGLRVLDFTRFVSGPYTTMLLACWGADVIKVELPTGDPYRHQGVARVGDEAALFLALNSGKRSLALDFRDPRCAAVLDRLLAATDFVVANAKPGDLERYGLGHDAVLARHPRVVYGSISGFGDAGPDAGRGGFDLIVQAEGGLMSVTGAPGCGPVKVGAPVLDVGSAALCAAGLLAAHAERQRTGRGGHVATSLLEFSLAALTSVSGQVLATGEAPPPLGSHSPTFAPYGAFRTGDGYVVLAGTGSERLWHRLCAVLDAEWLRDDERFGDNAARVRHRDELTTEIEKALAGAGTAEWVERLEAAGVPAGRVRSVPELLDSAQVAALGTLQELDGPGTGAYRALGAPVRLDDRPGHAPAAAPRLGQHTRDVLHASGLTADEIDALLGDGLAVAP